MRFPSSWALALPVCLATVASCSVIELERQAEQLSRSPLIHGDVRPAGWDGEPLIVILSGEKDSEGRHTVDYLVQHDPGPFYFYVDPGTYEIAVYEDRSGHLAYEPGDPVLVAPEPIVASRDRSRIEFELTGRLSRKVRLPARFDISQNSAHTRISLAHRNLGRVVAMDAPEMSLELGQAGMWDPVKYLDEVQVGIFFLEPFDAQKTPVLFVHGIGGAPIQFDAIRRGLDGERFQPWFFAYPSIFPLRMVAEALNAALDIVRRRHDFDRILIVAHSMGGLVTRAYLNEYAWSRHDYDVGLFVSLASPFGGDSGAATYPAEDRGERGPLATWIQNARSAEGERPHIAWTDMAPGSSFLETLYDEPLPPGLAYDLGFAFDPSRTLGATSDGTVSLESQLRPEAQREASHERGFLMGHDDVLVERDAVRWVLDRIEAAR